MQLDVLPDREPWYGDGLSFTCTQCGNCCTGGPGYVWISSEEIDRLAEFLKITRREVLTQYCRKFGDRVSLKERRMPNGEYDCVFLQPIPGDKNQRRGCSIYSVRPLQCRTWPFWDSNLESPERWNLAGERCPGMSQGSRKFTLEQIETIRDATDWPDKPPTSRAGETGAG
jgi:Fe-S-cluster containining protein